MIKKTTYLLLIIVTILLGIYFNWKLCCNKNDTVIKQEPQKVIIIETPSLSFGTKDADGNITFSLDKSLKFKKSDIGFSTIPEELDAKIGELKDFLITENDKSLSITGYFMSDEVNNSAFPNVGFARAIAIKNYVSKKGISTKLIDVKGELNDEIKVNDSDVMEKPLKFSVGKSVDQSAMINGIINEIKSNPLTLSFENGAADTNFTPKQRMKIVNISTYLDKVDNAFCSIIGHTDNAGSAYSNILLGKKRANFIKEYLVKSGISNDKINVTSKGETAPIASNDTEEGKRKNRRVVATID